MNYRVRTKDGELNYSSFEELRDAAQQGFVERDDEVQREGEADWKKAGSLQGLFITRFRGLWNTPLFWWVILAVNGAFFAMWAIHRGRALNHDLRWYSAALVVVFLVAGILFKVVVDAQKPHR